LVAKAALAATVGRTAARMLTDARVVISMIISKSLRKKPQAFSLCGSPGSKISCF
jgi:hypothetical protein